MKKAFVTLCVFMTIAMTSFASGDKETTRYYAPEFTQGWFIDLAGTYSIFACNGVTYHDITTYYGGLNANNPKHFFGATARLGRRVGPNTAIRAAYDWHPSENRHGEFNFKSLHIDVMESPIDLFFGYNPERFYTLWVYGGAGLLAYDPQETSYFIGWRSNLELGVHGGFMNNFRLSNSFDLHIDLTGVLTRWSFDDNEIDAHNGLWHRGHFDFSGMAGIMWYLGGRRLEVVENEIITESDCSKQEARINELLEQVNGLQNQLANTNSGQTVSTSQDTIIKFVEGESISYPFSIFFNKGSYDLRDGRDRVNLQEFADAAKQNGYKVILRGTCDSGTASAAFNKTLAENRCNKIKAELVKLGVPEENITINAVGGVKELTPTEYDRRVLIQLSK